MGIGDIFKKNNVQKQKINELDVLHLLQAGIPFHVVLPGLKTVRMFDSTSTSYSQDGIRQTVYHSAPTRQVPNSISANVQLTETQIIIQHAMANGRHIFINRKNIKYVTKGVDGFHIELVDGRRYGFEIYTKKQKKAYTQHGINPHFVIDVFYNLLTGTYERQYQQILMEKEKEEKERIEKQEKILKEKEKEEKRLAKLREEKEKEEKRLAKLREEKEKEWFEKKEKAKKKRIEEQNRIKKNNKNKHDKIFSEFSIKLNKLKEAYDIDAINQEEYDELKTKFISEVESIPIPEDINPMIKIKESKELLDNGAITQEEFNKLKSKFISEI